MAEISLIAALVVALLSVGGLFYVMISSAKKQQQLQQQLNDDEIKQARLDEQFKAELEKCQQLQTKGQQLEQQLAEKAAATDNLKQENSQLNKQLAGLSARYEALLSQSTQTHEQSEKRNQQLSQSLENQTHTAEQLKQQNSLLASQVSALKASQEALLNQQTQDKEQYAQQAAQYQSTLEKLSEVEQNYAELKTRLIEKEKHFVEQTEQFNQNKQTLSKEFENLANKIFEEKGKLFTERSQADLNHLLMPFKQQITGFQERVNAIHDESVKNHSSLKTEIENVSKVSKSLSEEALNLTKALKGDAQKRGAWGEAQLRKTLEMSGLVEGDHYSYQDSFDDQDGKKKRTDFLVRLPDNKNIIIDSKVTLNAYDETVAAQTPEQYQVAIKKHIQAVRHHVDDLADKNYTHLYGINSPDFTLLFMPIESAYIEALKVDGGLFEYAYKKNIILVSHTTLIPILRTVSNLWMIEKGNQQAREITNRAGEIYNQVCVLAERMGKLGNSLNTVGGHYNNALTALVGQQGLHNKVQRFTELSTKANKTFNSVEPVNLALETQRLEAIAMPLAEQAALEERP